MIIFCVFFKFYTVFLSVLYWGNLKKKFEILFIVLIISHNIDKFNESFIYLYFYKMPHNLSTNYE